MEESSSLPRSVRALSKAWASSLAVVAVVLSELVVVLAVELAAVLALLVSLALVLELAAVVELLSLLLPDVWAVCRVEVSCSIAWMKASKASPVLRLEVLSVAVVAVVDVAVVDVAVVDAVVLEPVAAAVLADEDAS